jgi:hypothetical protein
VNGPLKELLLCQKLIDFCLNSFHYSACGPVPSSYMHCVYAKYDAFLFK